MPSFRKTETVTKASYQKGMVVIMYYLGIDLGGTNIAVGLVSETGQILARKSVPTRAEGAAV